VSALRVRRLEGSRFSTCPRTSHISFQCEEGQNIDTKPTDTKARTDGFKKINGKWLTAHAHVSFPVDMRTGKADMESKP
jgi:hypothetical protein